MTGVKVAVPGKGTERMSPEDVIADAGWHESGGKDYPIPEKLAYLAAFIFMLSTI
ncbi:MAG: hypothetical protein GY697_00255 [Desulfobacterales bacterium]|nr:hypothetical protein [Desulfobacterales bacterium]